MTQFTTPEERRELSEGEAEELQDLRYRCWTDKPFTGKEYNRLKELERKVR